MSAMLDPPYDRPLEEPDPLAGLIDALTARRDETIEKGLHRIRTGSRSTARSSIPRSSTTCARTSRCTTT